MTVLAQVPPGEVLAALGDGAWWTRPGWTQWRTRTVKGVPLSEIAEVLQEVYSAETCLKMARQGYVSILKGLFYPGVFDWFGKLLALGLDLCACPNAARDKTITKGLVGKEWMGARLEAAVWGGLARAKLVASRPRRGKHEIQYEYDVAYGGRPYAVECKTLSLGNMDGNAAVLRELFGNRVVVHGMDPPLEAELTCSPHLVALMRGTQEQGFLDHVWPQVLAAVEVALLLDAPDGERRALGLFGDLRLTPYVPDGNMLRPWTVGGIVESPASQFRRLAEKLHEAHVNLSCAPANAHRIAIVWTGEDYLSAAACAQMLRENVGEDLSVDGARINLGWHRLGFDTGLLVSGYREPAADFAWRRQVGGFIGAAPYAGEDLPRPLVRALLDWRMHADFDDKAQSGTRGSAHRAARQV